MTLRTRYKTEIDRAAQKHGLDALLVEAVVVVESGGNTDAFRFEPNFWNRYLKMKPEYQKLNPRRVSSSYGLMQVMYCRVLEDKLTDNDALPPEHLFVPEFGLDAGCGLLKELIEWAGTLPVSVDQQMIAALAAYNGGRGGNNWAPDANGAPVPPRTAAYARAVLAARTQLAKEYSK